MRLRLDWRDGELFLGDDPLGARDELEAARVMLARNLAARDDTFTTWRGGMPCFTAGVAWAAAREVRSNGLGTPVFQLRRPRAPSGEAAAG